MPDNFMSDEEKMMKAAEKHLKLKRHTMKRLQQEGIPSEETRGNDAKGDIRLNSEEYTERAQDVIKKMNQ